MVITLLVLNVILIFLALVSIGGVAKLQKEVIKQRDLDVTTINDMFKHTINSLAENDARVLNSSKKIADAAVDAKLLQILAMLPTAELPQA